MNTPTKPSRPVHQAAASVARALLPLVWCPFVLAQQVATGAAKNPNNEGDPVVKLEAFAVTGSNIKRIEQEKTQPLTTLRACRFTCSHGKRS